MDEVRDQDFYRVIGEIEKFSREYSESSELQEDQKYLLERRKELEVELLKTRTPHGSKYYIRNELIYFEDRIKKNKKNDGRIANYSRGKQRKKGGF